MAHHGTKRNAPPSDDLRSQAEQLILDVEPPGAEHNRTKDETLRLIHELQVHQIELEMQNAELYKTRDEVEAALGKYTDLYDFAPVGYVMLDQDGVIRSANLTAVGLLDTERSRLTGRRFAMFIAASDRPRFAAFLAKALMSTVKVSCEVACTMAGELPCFMQIEGVAVESGQECRLALIDISDRKQLENALARKREELEDLNRTLETRIDQAVTDLRTRDEMLIFQERLAIMGEMINNIAHQWRQPLNTLGLLIQQLPLVYDMAEFSREFLEETSDSAMNQIRHMSATINDFKNFFRSDKDIVTFDVNQVIAHTLALIKKTFLDQKIRIDFRTDRALMLSGYPNEYAQVLLNILINARDALIGNNVQDARITVISFAEYNKVVVTIADNAGGVALEIIDRLFEPFFSTKGPDKGTGIGLFMSKTIIENNMGGSITVRNIEGGAEFRIEI